MLLWTINIILILFIIVFFAYPRLRTRMVAKLLDNADFNKKISENAQLVDIREPDEFRKKHILGARNLPASQIDQSLGALSKAKEILLYENGRPQLATKIAAKLKKSGYSDVFILKEGLVKWGGKIKEK